MKDWKKELYIYKLKPAPPKMHLQEYIELYLQEKDNKYISWFLHYYEPILNKSVMGFVQEYAMPGHFADLKSTCVFALLKALKNYDVTKNKSFENYYTEFYVKRAVHEYVRTMRTGYTIPTEDEVHGFARLWRCTEKTITRMTMKQSAELAQKLI